MDPRFRRQLVVGLAALVALVVAMAVTATVTLRSTTAMSAEVARDYADGFSHVQQLNLLEERLVATARGYLLSAEPALLTRYERSRADLQSSLSELDRHHLVPAAREHLVEVDRATEQYLDEMERAVQQRSSIDNPTQLLPMFDQRLAPLRVQMQTAVDALARTERAVFDGAVRDAQHRASVAEVVVIAASLLAILCSTALAVLVGRRLARQFHQVEDATAAARRAADAREEVLAIVSHDLRNPLQAIVISAGLAGESANGEPTRRYIRTIRNASERMQRMIDELLEASRLAQSTVELHTAPVDAADLLDTSAELFSARASDERIELRLDTPHVCVHADRERVVEVLSNLIGNALKFTQPGGHITVRAEPTAKDVRFTVEDDGSGIPTDQLPYVFERGWQGARRRMKGGGLGLGLYICKRLIEAHHGTIGVSSEVGHGARFWFTLPIDSQDPAVSPPANAARS